MRKFILSFTILLAVTLFTVPAFAEDEIKGLYPGAPYADIATVEDDGYKITIPEEYIFDEDKLSGTVDIKIPKHWKNGVVGKNEEIVPARYEEVKNYILVWRNSDEYFISDMYVDANGITYTDKPGEYLKQLLKNQLSSDAAGLFSYPYDEIVSINGEPWQETKWKDYIIKETKRRLKDGDNLMQNDKLWDIFIDPEYTGHAEKAYKQIKKEENTSTKEEESKEQKPEKQQKNTSFKGNRVVLQLGSQKVTVIKDGGTEGINSLDVAPKIKEGRTLIPLKGVLDELGASLSYNGAKNQVTVASNNQKIILNIGEKTAIKKGKTIKMDQPAVIENGRTLIPLRFVGERLGYSVDWNGETQKITVTK
ncbi:MAG: copper amine oxidase N-terminal domain-containing protein [Clostridiales bacterium]|nr:copper amine oxidase N-terminal domain-containing protein [Clostridiales bacterium]MCF8022665.1 copper amine oxidase N-terminal domain-containing protein [Clostridiales bacterium]